MLTCLIFAGLQRRNERQVRDSEDLAGPVEIGKVTGGNGVRVYLDVEPFLAHVDALMVMQNGQSEGT
jgi:hypothetical protein